MSLSASRGPNPALGFLLGIVGCVATFVGIAGIEIVRRGHDSSGPIGMLVVVVVIGAVFYLCRNRPIALAVLLGMGLVHVAFAAWFMSMPAGYRPSMAGARLVVGLVVSLVAIVLLVMRSERLSKERQPLETPDTIPVEPPSLDNGNLVEFADEVVELRPRPPLPGEGVTARETSTSVRQPEPRRASAEQDMMADSVDWETEDVSALWMLEMGMGKSLLQSIYYSLGRLCPGARSMKWAETLYRCKRMAADGRIDDATALHKVFTEEVAEVIKAADEDRVAEFMATRCLEASCLYARNAEPATTTVAKPSPLPESAEQPEACVVGFADEVVEVSETKPKRTTMESVRIIRERIGDNRLVREYLAKAAELSGQGVIGHDRVDKAAPELAAKIEALGDSALKAPTVPRKPVLLVSRSTHEQNTRREEQRHATTPSTPDPKWTEADRARETRTIVTFCIIAVLVVTATFWAYAWSAERPVRDKEFERAFQPRSKASHSTSAAAHRKAAKASFADEFRAMDADGATLGAAIIPLLSSDAETLAEMKAGGSLSPNVTDRNESTWNNWRIAVALNNHEARTHVGGRYSWIRGADADQQAKDCREALQRQCKRFGLTYGAATAPGTKALATERIKQWCSKLESEWR